MARTARKQWYRLDNAAKLYPAIATSRWSSTFRISAVLKEAVLPDVLRQAAQRVLPRFPSMAVCMRHGIFWYYLEANDRPLPVQQDSGHPCMPFRWKENNGYLLRVLYYKKRVSVEFFHSIADGSGGLAFLKTLVAEYLRTLGAHIPATDGVLDPKEKPHREEREDAFQRVPLPPVKSSRRDSRAYHLPGDADPPHTLHVINAAMPFPAVHAKSKPLDATVTEYLAGALLYAAYKIQKETGSKPRPIRISIPVNLRNFHKTETLRNFSSFVNAEIDPRLGDYTFEEIVREVHNFMRYQATPKHLLAGVATNVADERKLFLRLAPLPIKNLVINTVFRAVGERAVTTTLTSIGRVAMPRQMAAYVDRFELMLGASLSPCCNCALVTTGDTMLLTFTRNQQEATLARETLRFLVEQGIPVTVQSNQED